MKVGRKKTKSSSQCGLEGTRCSRRRMPQTKKIKLGAGSMIKLLLIKLKVSQGRDLEGTKS